MGPHSTRLNPWNVSVAGPRVHRTRVGNDYALAFEHLLAALYGLQVTDATIILDQMEPPAGDCLSAIAFCDAILERGKEVTGDIESGRHIPNNFFFKLGESYAESLPAFEDCSELVLEVDIAFPPPIGIQVYNLRLRDDSSFLSIADARSFMRSPVDQVWPNGRTSWDLIFSDMHGLHGPGSGQIITFDRQGHWIDAPNRKTEPAEHKVIDLLGELSLLGAGLRGRLKVHFPGHQFNLALVKELSKFLASDESKSEDLRGDA
jgi:UDP-3-O-acyl-N-acetylglucosamine deacetylase